MVGVKITKTFTTRNRVLNAALFNCRCDKKYREGLPKETMDLIYLAMHDIQDLNSAEKGKVRR